MEGIRYGFRGFFEQEGELRKPVQLTPRMVETIHLDGGSILGSSRGGSDTADIVDAIAEMELDFLFVIGGNGSHAGALAIDNMCKGRGLCTSVIGRVFHARSKKVHSSFRAPRLVSQLDSAHLFQETVTF